MTKKVYPIGMKAETRAAPIYVRKQCEVVLMMLMYW
jgi:hypothetical protein